MPKALNQTHRNIRPMTNQYNARRSTLRALLLCACYLLSQSHSALAIARETKQPQKTHQATKRTAPKSSSEESPAQRDKRLYRECKGMPNAGACLGYTRK